MDNTSSMTQETQPNAELRPSEGNVLRIPKPNWKIVALLLIALIAGFQMIQLARLKGSVVAKSSAATAAAPTASSSSGSVSSSATGLQSQVGGC